MLRPSDLYRHLTALHALFPHRYSKGGWALPPWHYVLELTRNCNLQCRMCQYRNDFDKKKNTGAPAELSTKEWFEIIDQTTRLGLLTFTGGEPLFRPDFWDILVYASKKRRTHFISNGLLLDEEKAHLCIDLAPRFPGGKGLNFIGISIEGPERINDAIRGRQGGYQRSSAGVSHLHRLRKEAGKKGPSVHITSVIQSENVDSLAQMPALVAEMGGDIYNLTLESRSLDLEGIGCRNPYHYKREEISYPQIARERVLAALRETRRAGEEAGIEVKTPEMPDEVIAAYYSGEMNLAHFRCLPVWSKLGVSATGDVYPTCFFNKLGNIRGHKLNDFVNHKEVRAFRRQTRAALPQPCAGCCAIGYCANRKKD